jgi:hypothetical protein
MATVESLSKDISDLRETLLTQLNVNTNVVTSKVVALEDVVSKSTKELNDAIFHVRNHVLSLLFQENVKLRDRVHTLESRLIKVESQLNRLEQNNRKSNFEFDGIPQDIGQDQLAPTVVKIVNEISEKKIEVNDVEAVHRLHSKRKPQPVIVRMKRNFIDSIHKNRKKLKDVGEKVDLPGAKIFVNHNISPNMKNIEFNARQLLKDGLISECWFSNIVVKIKCLNGTVLALNHEFDLYHAFPRYEGFSFDVDLYDRILNNDMIEQFEGIYGYYGDVNHDVPNVNPVL